MSIGSRPVDLHLKGFEALGAEITRVHGYIHAKSDKLKGAEISLGFSKCRSNSEFNDGSS